MTAAVSVSNLVKQYGEFTAVSGISFEVRPGEVYALLGPNGAGKTTTIRMLTGILSPTSGTARIKDLDCFTQRPEIMRYVGYLPDEPVFYDYLRGREIIQFAGEMHGLTDQQIRENSGVLIEQLGLENDLEEYAANYSKGMKKKLALVISLQHEPELFILDEPTYGLDPRATRIVHSILRERVEAGLSVFFSTHLLDQAEKLCTRVGIMNKGLLAAEGELGELRKMVSSDSSLEEIYFAVTGSEEEISEAAENE